MNKKENTAYSTLTQKFNLLKNEPLKRYTSFKIGGPADLLALPKDQTELKKLIKQASDLDVPVTLLGGGTNVLITDKGIRGLVIVTRQLNANIHIIETQLNEKIIFVEAGVRLSKVCQFAINHSLTGIEFAAGIPGTVGGAIMMNAGTESGSMSDIVNAIEVLNQKTLAIETIDGKDLDFSYRHLNQPGIIVAAKLTLTPGDQNKIEETFKQNLIQKNATQPVSFASAGCFFKNPVSGKPAGELIEKTGLKGMRINDAMVSRIHANYIINVNAASCEDVLLLKQQIQQAVFEKYHIQLETEVRVQGE
ncbi:MAG: UDP-N-acetylmuramate dehydrogenase [Proteobacteria bacterium]|nr:UDP-N-acetylmuramate dehydrogenase [Pseudomonadota bacterium]MBU1585582.1 UDP-N-acetylmuramate dehydrogenase [Pseudomonadota bacterium]MBU2452004.1 UDP-N-acetylmuramate dehydrogenase [Pseudomonadota bacterium]MBU2628564.1 UDP-N-acetylmuramate dehydrogenase [Pseudomonadota bacterium]